jgi:hypothetical protein
MIITFRRANRYEPRVRWIYFNPSRPGNFLILLLIVIVIFTALFDQGVVGEIKTKLMNKTMSQIGGHASRIPPLVSRHA